MLALPLLRLVWKRPPMLAPTILVRRASRPAPGTPSAAALREAQRYWGQAVMAVKPELEAWAAEHPDVITETEARHPMLARDPSGDLRRAHAAAQRAAARARTPEEIYQAEVWLALIECDRGRHQTELQHAQRLVVLQPRNRTSWGRLRRAAQCNGLARLARQAAVRMQAHEDSRRKLPVWADERVAGQQPPETAGDPW